MSYQFFILISKFSESALVTTNKYSFRKTILWDISLLSNLYGYEVWIGAFKQDFLNDKIYNMRKYRFIQALISKILVNFIELGRKI